MSWECELGVGQGRVSLCRWWGTTASAAGSSRCPWEPLGGDGVKKDPRWGRLIKQINFKYSFWLPWGKWLWDCQEWRQWGCYLLHQWSYVIQEDTEPCFCLASSKAQIAVAARLLTEQPESRAAQSCPLRRHGR